jgi:superfamily II DNA or RNA helicase
MLDVPCLLVIVGATAVGKTALAIKLAQRFQAPILSADFRSPLAGEPNKLETHWPCDILLLYLAHSPLAGEPNKLEKNWKKIGKKEKIKPNFPACDFL